MIRKEIYKVEPILKLLEPYINYKKKASEIDLDGDKVYANSLRYTTFLMKGIECKKCGLKGYFFAKERELTSKRYHLNLYAIDENGQEVLMTKDHIVPKSKGGSNNIDNFQTLCKKCNEKKADLIEGRI